MSKQTGEDGTTSNVNSRTSTSSAKQQQQQQQQQQSTTTVWYCPSRWLLAHHDASANIHTLTSHMTLADLNNDGESLLVLIDFKQRPLEDVLGQQTTTSQARTSSSGSTLSSTGKHQCPFECRMRVYRGQHVIINRFLDDLPSCLLATSLNLQPLPQIASGKTKGGPTSSFASPKNLLDFNTGNGNLERNQAMLTLAINDDVYFYHKLKPSHRLSLEDDECILDSMNKSEVDAWQMVKQNKVDVETLRDLLISLNQELGNDELSSHSVNFLSMSSGDSRKQYLLAWKYKRLQNGSGENIMNMDTICCAAARLKYTSSVTMSGDYGHTRNKDEPIMNTARWNRIIEIQRDGLVLGTEDRHLLIYELRSVKTRLECHYRLPSTPDHILVERLAPSSFDTQADLKNLTYKILIACRNSRIYLINQLYLVEQKKSSPCKLVELIALKCNVLQMSWTGVERDDSTIISSTTTKKTTNSSQQQQQQQRSQTFIVACLDRRIYCFSSATGQCKWMMDVELPITSLVCLPKLLIGQDETSLVGVASQANRIDFYTSSNGRIVDSIYFNYNDYPQAMTFGRFGREDNCLCVVTSLGQLLIFILKRTAKFVHGQCLSSAGSYASDTLTNCGHLIQKVQSSAMSTNSAVSSTTSTTTAASAAGNSEVNSKLSRRSNEINLSQPASVPCNLALSKADSSSAADKLIDSVLHSDHQCNRIATESALKDQLKTVQLPLPTKSRDFVNQIIEQSKQSAPAARILTRQLIKLKETIKSTMEQQKMVRARISGKETGDASLVDSADVSNRIMLSKVDGLGNIYQVQISFRLYLAATIEHYNKLILRKYAKKSLDELSPDWSIMGYISPARLNDKKVSLKPHKFVESLTILGNNSIWDKLTSVKLTLIDRASTVEPMQGEVITLDVRVILKCKSNSFGSDYKSFLKMLCNQSINVPIC